MGVPRLLIKAISSIDETDDSEKEHVPTEFTFDATNIGSPMDTKPVESEVVEGRTNSSSTAKDGDNTVDSPV